MHTCCVESTRLNDVDNNQQEADGDYIAQMKKQTQLLPIEFGQYYLEHDFGIESVVVQCEPNDLNPVGKYVWQIMKSDQQGFPSCQNLVFR